MLPSARRIALHPLSLYGQEALEAASFEVAAALEGRTIRVGDEVQASSTGFVVAETDPTIPVRATRQAELEIRVNPLPAPAHAVYDALFLLDSSWSMSRDDYAPSRFAQARQAVENVLTRGGDVVRACGLAVFTREPVLLSSFEQLARMDVRALDGVQPHGRADLAEAVSGGVAELRAGADAKKHHALIITTDEEEPDAEFEAAVERAARLRVELHFLHFGAKPNASIEAAARRTRGTYAWARQTPTLRHAFEAMAGKIGLPLAWPDEGALSGADLDDLEIVVRARPPTDPEDEAHDPSDRTGSREEES